VRIKKSRKTERTRGTKKKVNPKAKKGFNSAGRKKVKNCLEKNLHTDRETGEKTGPKNIQDLKKSPGVNTKSKM